MNTFLRWFCVTLLTGLLVPAWAAGSAGLTYAITSSTLNSGVGDMASTAPTGYHLSGSMGDTVSGGLATGTTYSLNGGFASGVDIAVAQVSTATIIFASQSVGTTSGSQAITMTNLGAAQMALGSVTISGDFAQSGSCSVIAPGASCSLAVTFAPTAAGARTGTLSIVSNAAGSPYVVNLSGTGTAIGLTAQTITFPAIGNKTLGSAPFAPTVSASSGLPVTLTSQTAGTCSVSGLTVSLLVVGTCTLQATQTGNTTYAAATPVSQSFNIVAASTNSSGDVPLPPWAYVLLAAGLMGAMWRYQKPTWRA
jgi:hypothetical protein